MNRLGRYLLMLRIFLIPGGYPRAEFLKKKNYFKAQGEHCYLQPWNFGTEPHLITFGDNVHVASNVTFINHDVTCFMFEYMDKEHKYKGKTGKIAIGNNVFIGANSTILYNVKIGDNVVIGANSLVTKDIPSGVVAAGIPCKIIGDFDTYRKKLQIDN